MTFKIQAIMKYLVTTFIVLMAGLGFSKAQELDCKKNQLRYEKLLKDKQYQAAYPIWKEQLTNCPKLIVNIYNHADNILEPLIKEASGAKKEQYIDDLMLSFDQRLKYFPEDKNLYKGNKIMAELEFGRIDSLTAFNKMNEVFDVALNTNTKTSSKLLDTYLEDAVHLYYYKKLNDDQYLQSYDKLRKVVDLNIELRNEEKAPLEDKLYGKTDSLGNVLVAKTKLNYKEQQIYDNSVENIAYLQESDSIYSNFFNRYMKMTCSNVNRIVAEGFEQNKDNDQWLIQYYWLMYDEECNSPEYEKVLAILMERYPPEKGGISGGSSSRSVNGSALLAGQQYNTGNYSGAIANFKKAIQESSSTNSKAQYAVNIAAAYSKLGSWGNVVNWANQALSYRPGYSQANKLIAFAYYKGAGQLPGNSIKQRAAGWVAADFARRAGDSKTAAQYDRSAPSSEECFLNGITPGSSYKVEGWINKTTTARCVKR